MVRSLLSWMNQIDERGMNMLKRLMLIMLLSTVWWQISAVAETVGTEQSLQQVTLQVKNMSCGMCQYTVENALKQVEGVKSAKVDMEKGIAVVSFDPAKVGSGDLAKAVSDAGYPASVID